MRLTVGLLLVLLSAVSLGGCLRFRSAAGPCYGVGCPALTAPSGSSARNTSLQSASAQAEDTTANQANSSADKKSHGIHALLKKVKL